MGCRYLIRFAMTKPESRMGTARTQSGKNRATTAFVFSDPRTVTAASRYPNRFDPVSPMKLEAGGNPCRRKPRAAPAVSAASTPAPGRSRERAMIDRVSAEITHTPAASPSTPSMKLMTFMTATKPTTVTIWPTVTLPSTGTLWNRTWVRSTPPTNGSVKSATVTPLKTGIIAAAIWPISFTPGGRSETSARTPTAAINTAPNTAAPPPPPPDHPPPSKHRPGHRSPGQEKAPGDHAPHQHRNPAELRGGD